MARVRTLVQQLVVRGASLAELVEASSKRLGMPIRVRQRCDLGGPAAVSAVSPDLGVAVVEVDRRVSEHRRRHVIAHELGHLLLGHGGGERRNFDTKRERDAELFATLAVRRMRLPKLSSESRALRW